jgi:hypothetical protein
LVPDLFSEPLGTSPRFKPDAGAFRLMIATPVFRFDKAVDGFQHPPQSILPADRLKFIQIADFQKD